MAKHTYGVTLKGGAFFSVDADRIEDGAGRLEFRTEEVDADGNTKSAVVMLVAIDAWAIVTREPADG